jgi:hypothetical protein
MTIDPEVQAKGTAAASAARAAKAAERRAQEAALASHPLETPEDCRDYLKLVLRGVVDGSISSRAGAAAASVAAKLVRAYEVSITAELKALRAEREQWGKSQHSAGVSRRNR